MARLADYPDPPQNSPEEFLQLNQVLDLLASEEPRVARVVELRCFGGLSHREIGEVPGIDERTAKPDWLQTPETPPPTMATSSTS